MKKPTVGVIGLGIMGGAVAKNLQAAGFPVVTFTRSGKGSVSSPKEVGEKADAIITMVTDHAAVKEVALGANGFLSANVKGKAWLQMSTVNEKSTLEFAQEAGERGMEFLDCPVMGSKKQVNEAQLIILAAGKKELIEKWRAVFMGTAKAIVHAGVTGKGTALKLAMNLAVVQMTTALCEAFAFAKNQGVSPDKIFEVIDHSPALNCGYFQIKKKALLENDFSPAFSVANMLKDVRYMDEAAKQNRQPLPVTQAVRFILEAAVTEGLGAEDLTSIVKILEPRTKAAV